MPIYEYKCSYCGYQFEELQQIRDKALKTCPKCHKPKLEKLISSANFHLKGTGWYKTDYKKTEPPRSAEKLGRKQEMETKKAQPADTTKQNTPKEKIKKLDKEK